MMIIFYSYEDIICICECMQKRFANKLIECYECLLRLENQSISFVHTECTVQWLRASELMNIVPKCYFYIISNVCLHLPSDVQIWIMWLSACFYCSVCVVIVASHILIELNIKLLL